MNEIIKIKGVGPVLAKAFAKKGFSNVENIADGKVADLATVSGVSEKRAKELIKAAKLLLKNLALTEAARKAKPAKSGGKPASKSKKKKKNGKKKNESKENIKIKMGKIIKTKRKIKKRKRKRKIKHSTQSLLNLPP